MPVVNPETGRRFTISLWEWHGALWGVRVLPLRRVASDRYNGFAQAHRMVSREYIEEWLGRLRLR